MNTLSWAEQSAAKGDYGDAIAWLDVITAIGDELPEPYPSRRASWQAALSTASASGEARIARLRSLSDRFPSVP